MRFMAAQSLASATMKPKRRYVLFATPLPTSSQTSAARPGQTKRSVNTL